jgi:hypothetical protein
MTLKDIRNRINKKINGYYEERQKLLARIKDSLNIDFNKISYFKQEIIIDAYPHSGNINMNPTTITTLNLNVKETQINGEKDYFFKIVFPESIFGNSRFYYKGTEIDFVSLEMLYDLERDLDYILKEIEKEINKLIG